MESDQKLTSLLIVAANLITPHCGQSWQSGRQLFAAEIAAKTCIDRSVAIG
jgi:hypothetical protein